MIIPSLFKYAQNWCDHDPFINEHLSYLMNEKKKRNNIRNVLALRKEAKQNPSANQRASSCGPADSYPISCLINYKLHWPDFPHRNKGLNSWEVSQSEQSWISLTYPPPFNRDSPGFPRIKDQEKKVSAPCLLSFSKVSKHWPLFFSTSMYFLFILRISAVLFSLQLTQRCQSSKASLVSFVVISKSITTFEITVFDTTGSVNPTGLSPHLRTLSLREVGTCDDIVTQYNPPSLDSFEVLRRVSEPIINVLTCQFLATLIVKYCGYDGIHTYTYGAKPVYRQRQIRMSKGVCLGLFMGNLSIFRLKVNLSPF